MICHGTYLLRKSINRCTYNKKKLSYDVYLSISETYFVKNWPLSKSKSEPRPPKIRLFFVSLTRTSRTNSPIYIPDIIFSYLKTKKGYSVKEYKTYKTI